MKVFFGKRATSAILLALIAVILGLIVLGSYYAFQRFESKGSESLSNVSTPIQEEEPVSPGVPPPGETVPPGPGGFNYKIRVIECNGNCDKGWTANGICHNNYGSESYAVAVDCSKMHPDLGGSNHTRTFNHELDWCGDTGEEDLTVTCAKGGPDAKYKVRLIECSGDCYKSDSGWNAESICENNYGSDYHPIAVDCANIEEDASGSGNKSRTFYDTLDWCHDTGTVDFSVTCTNSSMDFYHPTFIIECSGDCWKDWTANSICHNQYGSKYNASAVDCAIVEEPSSGTSNFNRKFTQKLDWCKDTGGGIFPSENEQDIAVTCYRPTLSERFDVSASGVSNCREYCRIKEDLNCFSNCLTGVAGRACYGTGPALSCTVDIDSCTDSFESYTYASCCCG